MSPDEDLTFCDDKGDTAKAKRPWDFIPAGHKIGKPVPLFKELVSTCYFVKVVYYFATFLHVLSLQLCRQMLKWRRLGVNLRAAKLKGAQRQKLMLKPRKLLTSSRAQNYLVLMTFLLYSVDFV
jgi:hypothetical protein